MAQDKRPKTFYIIVIDAGWPTVAHDVLRRSTNLLKAYLAGHHLIFFTREESRNFLREHPEDIDKDPIILITDTHPKKARKQPEEQLSGIRIDLGAVQDRDEVIRHLQELCKLIRNEDFVKDVSWEERRRIARTVLRDVVRDMLMKFLELVV